MTSLTITVAEPPVIHKDHTFVIPSKQVKSAMQLNAWKTSQAHQTIVGFIMQLNSVIRGKKKSSSHQHSSPVITKIVNFLNLAKEWIKEIPPQEQAQRFGNKAFRTWYQRLLSTLPEFFESLLEGSTHGSASATEISTYLAESFGNQQRIDYGTGHEFCFVTFLSTLQLLGIVDVEDHLSLVLDVFWTYLSLMQELQITYWLEPAGSKGAWGLDDYQFLPFLWGSSQLIGSNISPSVIHKETTVNELASEYLFFNAIQFVRKMKTGPFSEHSSMLNTISGVPQGWPKINSGLINMYDDEVLNKFPVVQHIYFGSLLTLERAPPPPKHDTMRPPMARKLSESKSPTRKPQLQISPNRASFCSTSSGLSTSTASSTSTSTSSSTSTDTSSSTSTATSTSTSTTS